MNFDPRPYAKININDYHILLGLLDKHIQTADGSINNVLYVELPVTYINKTKLMKFCVVPLI